MVVVCIRTYQGSNSQIWKAMPLFFICFFFIGLHPSRVCLSKWKQQWVEEIVIMFFHDSRGSFVTCPAHCKLDLSIPELNEGNIHKKSQHVLPPSRFIYWIYYYILLLLVVVLLLLLLLSTVNPLVIQQLQRDSDWKRDAPINKLVLTHLTVISSSP